MTAYPVHYSVAHPRHFTRVQLLARFVAFCALGLLGLSFGGVFLFGYIALPVYAAARLAANGAPRDVSEERRWILRVVHWFAAVSAWAGLVAERLPGRRPEEVVRLEVDGLPGTPQPTARAAIVRVFTGLPSALVLAVLCCLGVFVWLWAALTILVSERVGAAPFNYLVGLQRWSVRLLLYQATLVDEYPPFSFADPPAELPTARVAV